MSCVGTAQIRWHEHTLEVPVSESRASDPKGEPDGQGPRAEQEDGGGYLTRPTSTRVWPGRCLYLHGSVGKRQGESSRRADGDYLMVSTESTQRPSTETTKRAVKCRPSVGAAGSKSCLGLIAGHEAPSLWPIEVDAVVACPSQCSVCYINQYGGRISWVSSRRSSWSCSQQARAASEHIKRAWTWTWTRPWTWTWT